MVSYRDGALSRLRDDATPMRRLVERAGIHLLMARETGLSEAQVERLLSAADRLIDHAPLTWAAFSHGHLDAARAREISVTITRLERDDSIQRLDDEAVAYARTHTVAELRRWLRRFVSRVEADLAIQRANAEREKRSVTTAHVDEGMAVLQAYLPSHQAAAIENRLQRTAAPLKLAATRAGTRDTRTVAQVRADLLAHLLTSAETDEIPLETALRCDIAVTFDASVLTGAVDRPVESADGSWDVPADWVLDSALLGDAYFHRLLLDPICGDTVAHDYAGYSPPESLRRAIRLRDGVCVTPGCLVPADRCELDHHIPWPQGTTCWSNLRSRCKRHHAMKGHRTATELLDPVASVANRAAA